MLLKRQTDHDTIHCQKQLSLKSPGVPPITIRRHLVPPSLCPSLHRHITIIPLISPEVFLLFEFIFLAAQDGWFSCMARSWGLAGPLLASHQAGSSPQTHSSCSVLFVLAGYFQQDHFLSSGCIYDLLGVQKGLKFTINIETCDDAGCDDGYL